MKFISKIEDRGSYLGEALIAYRFVDGYRLFALSLFRLTLVAEFFVKKGKPLKTNFYHIWTP